MRIRSLKHILPLFLLAILAIIVYLLGFSSHLSLETLKQKEHFLLNWAHCHPFLSAGLLFLLYVISTCLLIPACTVLTLFAGMVYPMGYALTLSILGETVGACTLFWILQNALFPSFLHRSVLQAKRMGKEFRKNPACYLLFLRFSHFTPSWLIITGSVIFKAPFLTFAWTTLLGTIPISYLVVDAAKTAHHAKCLATWNWHNVFTVQNNISLFCLGIVSLIPIFIQRWKKR